MQVIKRRSKSSTDSPLPGEGRNARALIGVGAVLAVVAGVAAFVILSQAQEQARNGEGPTVAVVVANKTIPARKTIEEGDLTVRELPEIAVAGQSAIVDPAQAVGRVAAVPILAGQIVTPNLFATAAGSGAVAILSAEEEVTTDSPMWRGVSINVPDDRALGGLLEAGQAVDVFATVSVNVGATLEQDGEYYGDKSTKIVYQDLVILAKKDSYYVLKVTTQIAEEIIHLQASGSANFSLALRPDADTRVADAANLGQTTNLFIERYRLPIPETYPGDGDKIRNPAAGTPAPIPNHQVAARPTPAPGKKPAASAAPSAVAGGSPAP